MGTRFLVGDTHFGHKHILQYEPEARPFASLDEMHETIIERWNADVRPNDTVWHLGDVLFGKHNFNLLRRLNGHKRLVMGNHDNYPMELYLEHFERVCGAAKIEDVLLSHVPIHPSQFYRFRGNVHGHMHSNALDDKRYFNVSIERTKLAPIAWEEVLKHLPRK